MMRRILFVLVLAALLVGTASAVLPVTDGLVAAWDFQQGANPAILYDISGNNRTGEITGAATWTDEGLLLDGATAYVHNINLGNLGPDYTVIAVAKTEKDANQVIFGRISATVNDPTGKGFVIRKTGSAHMWEHMHYDGVANPGYLKTVRTMQPTDDWVMLTARADASSVEMIGGPKVTGGEAVSSGMVDHSGEYFIGRLSYANTWHFQGTIGYIAVYDRKLSDAELLAVQASIRDNMAKRGVVLPDPHQIIKPMVVLQTDDGRPSDYTTAYPLASARNIPLTHYVIAARIGNPGQLTWDQIHELRAAGFGIECHNYNHIDITTLTEAELRANLEAVNAAFIAAGLPTPEHHAYGYGQHDAASRAILADYRLSGRTVSEKHTPIMYWGQEFDWYQLRTKSINRDTTVDEIKGRIDDAIAQNYVLILYTHDISDDPGEVGCYTDRFEEILDYIAAKRDAGLIDPVTIDGLYRAMQGIRTSPATGFMTLHGETTGATFGKTVDYVGFVWGTTRHNNPEGTAPDASEYDHYWVSPAGDYREDSFSYAVPEFVGGTEYYYRSAARIDGTWYYGEELTYTVPTFLPVTDGLVAAWDFQQREGSATLYDISGNGHHGTIYGGTLWTKEGLHFDGSTAYVNVGNLGDLGPDYTVIAVVKKEDNGVTAPAIFGRVSTTSDTSNGRGFVLRYGLLTQYDGVGRVSAAADTLPQNWQMLTARANATAMSLTAGGGASGTTPPTSTAGMLDHTGDYYIGRLSYTSTWFFGGTISYLAVYDRALSDAEILSLQATIEADVTARGVTLPSELTPMIVISMDDGGLTDYTNAFRLASPRGIPLTSYVITSRIGNPGNLAWEQIYEMRAKGFGIECHNRNHVDLTTLSETELRADLEAQDAAFIAAGLPPPEHHAYPFTSSNAATRAIIAEYRDTGRSGAGVSNSVVDRWGQASNWYSLRAFPVYLGAESSIDEVKARIDAAIAGRYSLILYTHDISETPSTVGCHVDRFEEILDYVAAKRDAGLIEPVTIDGLYRATQGIRTSPATGSMTLHGETTGATFGKTVDYVGFVWGTTRHNNPEGTAPGASGYDHHWISAAGDYREDSFSYAVPEFVGGTEYYYRSAARIDGTWYYGEELTYTVPVSLPYVFFTYTADGDETRTGTPIHFQSTISGDATSWQWNFGDGTTSTERNPTHTFTATGTYRVTLTASNAYGSNSFSHTFHVYSGTVSPPTQPPTPPPPTWPYPPDPTPTPTFNGSAFRWDPETGYYTSYWFNREGSFIDVHGLFFALMLPLTQIFGSWVFLIIWGTLCMGLYLYTQDTTMPFIVGILGGSMMAFLMGEDALVVMLLTMAFAGGGILAKVLLGRV